MSKTKDSSEESEDEVHYAITYPDQLEPNDTVITGGSFYPVELITKVVKTIAKSAKSYNIVFDDNTALTMKPEDTILAVVTDEDDSESKNELKQIFKIPTVKQIINKKK
jgi:hypothetical protein